MIIEAKTPRYGGQSLEDSAHSSCQTDRENGCGTRDVGGKYLAESRHA